VALRISDLDRCFGTTLTKGKSQGWNFGMWGACISQGRFILGLTKLWHASFIAAPIFFYFFCPTCFSVLWTICVCVCMYVCVYVCIYIYMYIYIYIYIR
jgi:hypothetical protein